MNCEHCHNLLLDHLYGLLDASEAAELDTHLAACPSCAASHAETARMQGLIARAAKSAFPATKFEPPAAKPTPAISATVVPTVAPIQMKGHSFRAAAVLPWVVAASILVAIPGTMIPVLGLYRNAERANTEAETALLKVNTAARDVESLKASRLQALTDAEFRLTTAEQARAALLKKWREEQESRTATAHEFSVDVLKPASIQPGAPNDFVVVVNDRRKLWRGTGKSLVAEVHAVDASDAVIFSQALDLERTAERRHALRLPAGAWEKVKPGAELFLVVAEVDGKTKARTILQNRVRLAGPVYATLLTTDKAAYRPGERLFFRSLTLDRTTFQPPARAQILKYELRFPQSRGHVGGAITYGTTDLVSVGPNGDVSPVFGPDGQPVRGVGCGEFVLPPDLPDGNYVLRLSELQQPGGHAPTVPVPVTRTIAVRRDADNYRKEVHFAKASFSPGEMVEAQANLMFEGKPAANVAVTSVNVAVDGTAVEDVSFAKATDASGQAKLRFALPTEVLDGDVQLRVTFHTPRGNEIVAARVPVIGNRVNVEFFPECGKQVVAGVPCKVYVRATTPAGQPVHFRGTVTDGRKSLALVESFHDPDQRGVNRGLASFTYTPELGAPVWLKLESPAASYAPILAGVRVQSATAALLGGAAAAAARTGFVLPKAEPDGVVMSVLDPVTAPGEPIRVRLHSVGQARQIVVGAYTRGRLCDTRKVTVDADMPQDVKLMADADPRSGGRGGVVRITAFEEVGEQADLKPVAERLVFRKPGEVLNLALDVNGTRLTRTQTPATPAGANVSLGITATDEKGKPAAAILWAAAVNSGVAPGAKDRDLPTHFLLAGEVQSPDQLEYADFLLTSHPKAAEALDLLLGTQGWRRFAEQQVPPPLPGPVGLPAFYGNTPPDVTKLMIRNGQYAAWSESAEVRDADTLSRKYGPLYEATAKAELEAKNSLDATREQMTDKTAETQALTTVAAARHTAAEALTHAESARKPLRAFRSNAQYGAVGLAALALVCGLAAVRRSASRLPLGFSTLGAVLLAVFLIVASGWGTDTRADAQEQALAKPTAPDPLSHEEARAKATDADTDHHHLKAFPAPAPPAAQSSMASASGPAGRSMPVETVISPVAPGGADSHIAPSRNAVTPREYPPPLYTAPRYGVGMGGNAPSSRLKHPAPLPAPGMSGAGQAVRGFGGSNGANFNSTMNAPAFHAQLSTSRPGAPTAAHEESLRLAKDRARHYATDSAPKFVPGREVKRVADAKQEKELLVIAAEPIPPLVVREFAAPRPSPAPLADENTLDTVLWQPIIVLPSTGKTMLHFHLGATPGGYEVVVAGHTADGRLGTAHGLIRVAPATPIAPRGPVAPPAPSATNPPPAP